MQIYRHFPMVIECRVMPQKSNNNCGRDENIGETLTDKGFLTKATNVDKPQNEKVAGGTGKSS